MSLIANILAKNNITELQLDIAKSLIKKRKSKKLSRQILADRSGVSYGSLRRFEESGQISLENLLKIARHLDCLGQFKNLFSIDEYTSLDDLRKDK